MVRLYRPSNRTAVEVVPTRGLHSRALGEFAADHDVDAIFNATFAYEGAGFVQTATVEEFWAAVEANAR